MRIRPLAIVLVIAAAIPAVAADAPTQPETRFTANWRLRIESWDWFDTTAADGDYTFPASVLRLGLIQKRKTLDWMVEIEQPTIVNLPDRAIAPAPQGQLGHGATYFASNGRQMASAFPKQVFLRFHHGRWGANSLKLGRFEFFDGAELVTRNATVAVLERERIAQRLLGNFGFTHVGRSFDGAQFSRDLDGWNLTAMAGRGTRGVFHADGVGELDVDVQYAALTRAVAKGEGQYRIFGIGYHDGRSLVKVDNRAAPARTADHENIRIGTVGADLVYTHRLRRGTADWVSWGAVQFGSWGVQQQRAAALALEGGYQWNAPAKPWLRAGWFGSTGDGNPDDGTHGTFFQMLPTARIYARFPFFNLMNNQDAFAEMTLAPDKSILLRADVHSLRLSSSRDLWYQGGGAYEKATFGYSGRFSSGSRALANLYDFSVDVQLSSHASVTGYLGVAQPRTVVRAIYPGTGLARLGYMEFNYKY